MTKTPKPNTIAPMKIPYIKTSNETEYYAVIDALKRIGVKISECTKECDGTHLFLFIEPCGKSFETNAYNEYGIRGKGSVFIFSNITSFIVECKQYMKGEIKPVEVVLNDKYTATVCETGVKVGCQTFSFTAIQKLYSAVLQMEEDINKKNS